jgi:hypothetical protein
MNRSVSYQQQISNTDKQLGMFDGGFAAGATGMAYLSL